MFAVQKPKTHGKPGFTNESSIQTKKPTVNRENKICGVVWFQQTNTHTLKDEVYMDG